MENKNLTDVLLYFVPALLVMGAMYLVIKKFLERDRNLRMMELKKDRNKDSLPLRLQAIERMVLFMERISPDNLLPRLHRSGISSGQLHSELLATIRAEFEHNMTQQVYLSDHTWATVKDAREEIVKLINMALTEVGQQATGVHLSSKIFDLMIREDNLPHHRAIGELKNEARQLIG